MSRRGLTLPSLRYDQRRIAARPSRFKVVACGRRWGKTTLGIAMAVHHALDGARVWWVAPTYHHSLHPWHALKSRFAESWVSKTEYHRFIELPNGGSITIKTADNPTVCAESALILSSSTRQPSLTNTSGTTASVLPYPTGKARH
jgi:hypothetical protein